jgi:hypothetical protein
MGRGAGLVRYGGRAGIHLPEVARWAPRRQSSFATDHRVIDHSTDRGDYTQMTPRRTTSGKPTKDAGQPEKLMTVIQLAEHWQLSPRTIRRMITQGLPLLRFGRAVRIHPKVVAEFNSQPGHRNLQDADTDGR